MTRYYKFRAWDKKLKHYCSVFELFMFQSPDYVVEQSTGVKDINGKEIFEGDLLECPASWTEFKYKGEVVFLEGAFRLSKSFDPRLNLGHDLWYYDDAPTRFNWWHGSTVVGNINENPELRRVKKH